MSFLGVILGISIAAVITMVMIFGGFAPRFHDLWIPPLIAAFCGLFMVWGTLHDISNKLALLVQLQRQLLEKWQKRDDAASTPLEWVL